MIDEKEVLKILKRYEGRMNPTAYFGLEADIVNIEALEQEPTTKNEAKYCDRNICLKNEYNNIGCEDCEVTKSQEPTTKNDLGVDCRSLEDIKKLVERKADDLDGVMLDASGVIIGLYFAIANDLPSVTPQEPCDKCEVGNPCLYCKHEFEPQESEE